MRTCVKEPLHVCLQRLQMPANIVLDSEASGQYMAGGDLRSALDQDAVESGAGEERRLGWYARGRVVLLCIARGLAYLHSERVCACSEK